jgi:hypothetical protein
VGAASSWLAAAHLMQLSALDEITTLISKSHALHVLINTQVNELNVPSDCCNNVKLIQQQF